MDINEFMANIPQEGELPEVEPKETETPSESPTDEKPVVEEPAEEGDNTPTEKDEDYKDRTSKRVQELLKDRAEEKARREELEERLARLEQQKSPEVSEVPESWARLYSSGDPELDQENYQEWKALNDQQREEIKAELLAEMQSKEAQEAEETERMAAEYDAMMDELEAEGSEFDRNALMKYITDIPGGLWTTDGKPNFAVALRMMEAEKQPSVRNQVKKSLGSINKGNPGGTGDKPFFTPEDFRGFKSN